MHDTVTCQVIQDPDHPGEMLLDLGLELCQRLGWQPGDSLEWIDNGDGTWTIKKTP
jgi:hypothetical protein